MKADEAARQSKQRVASRYGTRRELWLYHLEEYVLLREVRGLKDLKFRMLDPLLRQEFTDWVPVHDEDSDMTPSRCRPKCGRR